MEPLLKFTPNGIYCSQGKFYIDPWKPVENAIITHGHSDHSRVGNKRYLCHKDSVEILKYRLGEISVEGVAYEQELSINGVKVSFHPAGHLLGSSQIRVEHKGEVWVASGDYKLEPDPIAEDFQPVKCHTFITECTFGLPIYNWPAPETIKMQMEDWWRENQRLGKTSLISAYALGKAQRVIEMLDDSIGQIYVHGAVHNINKLHQSAGFLQKDLKYLSPETPKSALEGALVVAPPSAIGSTWTNRLRPLSIGVASGWMMLRGSKRRQNVDRGFVLSDHADWSGLNQAIKETGAEQIICTHGYTGPFSEWLREQGYSAFEEKTLFEGESLENSNEEVT